MKITCQACQAKYTIADEKVVGKIVKIRCKKCGATIVVNGNEAAALGGTQPPAPANAFDYAGQGAASTPWTVNVADGDQRTMSDDEVVAAYRAGIVTDETFCWKEGQPDWLPIQEISPLHAACTTAGRAREEEHVAASTDEPNAGPNRGAAAIAARAGKKEGNGAAVGVPPAAAVAARRAGGRVPAADLFGGVARAGGEDEVLTSAPAGTPQHNRGGAPQPPSMTATSEASGLIDIRQLGAQMRSTGEEKKKSRVDDIMNLGGGGAFSPSLAAPVLAAPSLEHYSEPPPGLLSGPGANQAKSKALIFLALGAGTFFLVAAVAIAVVLVRGTQASASGAATTPAPGMSVAMETAMGAPQHSAAPEAPSATVPQPPIAAAAPVAQEAPRQETPKQEMPKKEFKPAPVAPREAPAASGAEFNLGEARSRLAAIVGGLQTCKRADTTGSGKVEIVFAPSGGVQSAVLMAGSPFDGTPTGKCVEARFRQARVPPFGGSPVPVTKSFSIN
jgi:predicted Zn finger-like uncharacterized protein